MKVQEVIDMLNALSDENKAKELAVSCNDCGLEESLICEPEVKSKHVRLYMKDDWRNKHER
jgi:hypothetical protein